MKILGLSAYFHDSAAALTIDGRIIAAAQEERFTRIKQDSRFPVHAVTYCLGEAGLRLTDLDHVAFHDKPLLKFDRLMKTYLAFAPGGFASFRQAMGTWLGGKLRQDRMLAAELRAIDPGFDPERLLFVEHHHSHAASAFYPSPFDEALVLTLDGVGEWDTTSAAVGRGNRLEILKEIHFPHSLGLFYSAFTWYTGFKVNSGEYKMMGLAPYGDPRFAGLIRDNLIAVAPDGSFRLNMDYFDYCTGRTMINSRFESLFGVPRRRPDELLTQFHMDVAASAQQVLEEVVLALTRALAAETGQKNLCLAGGVALNCVANGKVLRDGRFERIWVQPASGDAGGALGAALAAGALLGGPRPGGSAGADRVAAVGAEDGSADGMAGSYLGPAFAQDEIERRLTVAGAVFDVLDDGAMIAATLDALEAGKAVGWFQGRMEFGPRALGGRSILGDPRSPSMQKVLNLKVKFRESFRPFAPSVLREDVADWFDLDASSPYMLLVADVAAPRRRAMTAEEQALFGIDKLNVPRSDIPAVTHVDYSARVQTVHATTNPRYHALISAFKARTGCPVVVNTSFNIRSEPIVCTPEDAFRCFMGTAIEVLVVGNCVLTKERQDPALAGDYSANFEPD